MNNNIEILGAKIHTDDLRYSLQTRFSTDELARFALSLNEHLIEDREFLQTLLKLVTKELRKFK